MKSAPYVLTAIIVFGASLAVSTAVASAQATWTCAGVEATIVGTPDDDILLGTPGDDVIAALQGNDQVRGGGGDDIICGGKGDDTIYGGQGFDILFGAQGNDTLYSAQGAAETYRSDTRGARIFGGAGNDTIHGSNRWDRMQGGDGADTLLGYEGRDWLRAGQGTDQVDGGPGIDDLHGGNGNDTIALTGGDTVRGGTGLDLCSITAGAPERLISCGLNEREVPPPAPEPIAFQSFTRVGPNAGTMWDGELLGLYQTDVVDGYNGEPGRCYLLMMAITATGVPTGTGIARGSDMIDISLRVDGDTVFGLNVCDGGAADALGYQFQNDVLAPLGATVYAYKQILVPNATSGVIEAIRVGDERLEPVRDYAPIFLTSLPPR